jgi:S-adenosylmethionine:tRNA ribosyltransferase-isomerase
MSGWTRLVITPRTRLRVVDALLTGLHEPPATHLDMLGALLDERLLERAYVEVRERGYLWHEFGDAMLIV